MTNLLSTKFFNANWKKYQNSIIHNTLYHREMMEALVYFFDTNMKNQFSMVDVGCGDCSTIIPVLKKQKLNLILV